MTTRNAILSLAVLGAMDMAAQEKSASVVDLSAEPVHALVDQPPEYPGGTIALQFYLLQHMVIPDSLTARGINGTVKVRFVVDRTGKVRDPKIIFGLHPEVDGEALRLISTMADWQPGRSRGKPANVMYVLPIKFGKG